MFIIIQLSRFVCFRCLKVLVRKLDWFQINDWEGWKNKKQSRGVRAVLSPQFNKKVSLSLLIFYLFSILDILSFIWEIQDPPSPPQTFSSRKTDQNY